MKKQNKQLAVIAGIERFEQLLQAEVITHEDLQDFTEDEQKEFEAFISDKLSVLPVNERKAMVQKLEFLLDKNSKAQLWENNHQVITRAVAQYVNSYGVMPTKSKLAELTGLSRKTVHQHLKDFNDNPEYAEQAKQHQAMAGRVLSKMLQLALAGDMQAAKLYLQATGSLNGQTKDTHISNHHNYIQINGTIITEEVIRQLRPEQLSEIEAIIKALPG
jgi:hypothetical protein